MERTREMISHDHQNIVSQISFPDKRKFGPKQTDGYAGWDFPVPQAWKEIHVCRLMQKKPPKNVIVVTQVSFISWNQSADTEVTEPPRSETHDSTKCVLMFQLFRIHWDCAVVPRYWMRWSGGEASLQLWSTPSWGVSWNHPSLHQGSLSKSRPFCPVQEMRSELLTTRNTFHTLLEPCPSHEFCLKYVRSFFSVVVYQVIELRRPSDSRLEHVDFDSLFSCLSVRQVIRVFASLLLERRVIFVAEKLRWGWGLVRETLSLSLFTLRCVSSFLLA